jgi:hypothetical protein
VLVRVGRDSWDELHARYLLICNENATKFHENHDESLSEALLKAKLIVGHQHRVYFLIQPLHDQKER